jgi:hypothetical protein
VDAPEGVHQLTLAQPIYWQLTTFIRSYAWERTPRLYCIDLVVGQ